MSLSNKRELSLLKHDEAEVVRTTHYPAIQELDRKAIAEARRKLTTLRDTEKTFARQKAREVRGKSDARGGSFPGTAERPLERKQVFSSALRRVERRAAGLGAAGAGPAPLDAPPRALGVRRAAPPKHHPDAGKTADAGMVATSNTKGSTKPAPAKVGSVSQANKNAQAKRDKR